MRAIVTGARAPACLEWARVLSGQGWEVAVADSAALPLARFSTAVRRHYRLPAPVASARTYAEALAAAARDFRADVIVPTCEEVFYIAHQKHAIERACRVFTSDFALLRMLHDKDRFAALTSALPIRAPETWRLESVSDLAPFRTDPGAYVFKPVFSRFASRTLIRPTARALDAVRPTPNEPWIAQRFAAGEELCSYSVLHEGRVLAHACYHPRYRVGQASGIYFEPRDPAAVRDFLGAFGRATGYSGQVGFDFIDGGDAGLSVLECNPRATSGIHLLAGEGRRLAMALEGRDEPEARPAVGKERMVGFAMALFALPRLRSARQCGEFFRAWRSASDVISIDGDRWPLPGQLAAFAEIVVRAVVQRQRLLSAATSDIEWNGQDLGEALP
jgi:hypothetical protein